MILRSTFQEIPFYRNGKRRAPSVGIMNNRERAFFDQYTEWCRLVKKALKVEIYLFINLELNTVIVVPRV